ncbi:MAG: ATP synthase F1 subunit epsilon [Proteobacteria bacterium]|nr:ATP synthase F1 subunit epsilon [Pseudomonadota bacterium]
MAKEFEIEVLTRSKTLYKGKATEVVLPAYDGEVGVLADHANFIGLLGTGPLKVVTGGDDYWYMLSNGTYFVEKGNLNILADVGEQAESINIQNAASELKDIETQIAALEASNTKEQAQLALKRDQLKALIEAHRRTNQLN